MTQANSPASLGSSRLVNELSRALSTNGQTKHESFAENLSTKIDFAGSVKLSDAHGEVRMINRRVEAGVYKSVPSDPDCLDPDCFDKDCLDKCQQAFVRVRKAIAQQIQHSFEPDTVSRSPFPVLSDYLLADTDSADDEASEQDGEHPTAKGLDDQYLDEKHLLKLSEAIKKHYRNHQADMSARVQGLKVHIREQVLKHSPDLDQLVILDTALDESLSLFNRQALSVVSQLVQTWTKDELSLKQGENQDLFVASSLQVKFNRVSSQMKRLLLAELELRLQSTLGLIEALHERVTH